MRFVVWMVLSLGLVLPVRGQSYTPHLTRQLQEAHKLEEQGQWRAARRAYEAVLLRDRQNVEALRGLARIAMRQEKWAAAGRRWQQVLKLEPEDMEAHYYRAICYREEGVTRPPIARNFFPWRKAAREFTWVLARDSLYRDVLYQFALLRRYEGKYEEALDLGMRQLRLKPDDEDVHIGLFDLYRYFIHHRSLQKVRIYWEHHREPYSYFFWGEAQREAGQLEEARRIYERLLKERPEYFPVQPLWLALARVYVAQGADREGEQAFWKAVATIRNRLGARLVFEDVLYILSDDELATYKRLHTPEEYQRFFRTLWLRRDPMPAAPYNVRLVEHYRRMLYAEKHFVYDGFRLWFNNPDKYGQLQFPQVYHLNHRFNDKGLVFIRHGPPNDRAFTLGEDIVSNESWRYYPTSEFPELIFHFLIDRTGGAGNNWRLAPLPDDPRIVQDRVQWGRVYHRLLRAEGDLERLSLVQELVDEANASIAVGLNTDRHTWPADMQVLPLPIQVIGFQDGKHLALTLFYTLPLDPLRESRSEEKVPVQVGFSVYTTTWDSLFRDFRLMRLDVSDPKATMYVDGYRVRVPPDTYEVALFVRPMGTSLVGGWKLKRSWQIVSNRLQISEPVICYRVRKRTDVDPQGSVFERRGWWLTPNPTRTFSQEEPLWLYYEVYHLKTDAEGHSRYRITYTLRERKPSRKGLGKILGLFSRKPQVVLTLEAKVDGRGNHAEETAELDIRTVPPGAYTLIVEVTDEISRHTARQEQLIRITAGAR